MGQTLAIRISHDSQSVQAISDEVAGWLQQLNQGLSATSETFEVYEGLSEEEGAWVALAKPGGQGDIKRVIKACMALRASHPDLSVRLTDDFECDLLGPEAPAPQAATRGVAPSDVGLPETMSRVHSL